MIVKIAYPVICQFNDGFREPEGDVIFDSPPKVGDKMILSDKKEWIVVKVEKDYDWPKVIVEKIT